MTTGTLRLPRLISDGMVIQRRKSIHIWGWDEEGSTVSASLGDVSATGIADEKGRFDIYLPARESGGPYELVVRDDRGCEKIISDIYIGLVWLCSGQSNMELPVEMVKDRYPHFKSIEENQGIRTFKIDPVIDFKSEREELQSGSWVHVSRDSIMDFSATGYFFAKTIRDMTGLTVGFIDASLGGSRISCWMSREMLMGYDDLLAEADKYSDDTFRQMVENNNEILPKLWREDLDKSDMGLTGNWTDPGYDDSSWKTMDIPVMFEDTELKGLIGVVWFRKHFDLPSELAGKECSLWLGTLVDRDEVYVNGVKVGETEYQYPPRKYSIPEGLTRKEGNTIVIRLCVENGLGRLTLKKEYMLFNEKASLSLEGSWKYKVGGRCKESIPPTDVVNWKSTGLYNAMTKPCTNYPVDGIVWYQGESDTYEYERYADLSRKMIKGYRKLWGEENLPFIFVQLPNFVIDIERVSDPWPRFRLSQKELLDDPDVGMAVTIDVGEDNDLHPTEKEPVGYRLALIAARLRYGYNGEYTGPEIESARILPASEMSLPDDEQGTMIELTLSHGEGLHSKALDKGDEIMDFEVVSYDGSQTPAMAVVSEEKIILRTAARAETIRQIRYMSGYTYKGGLIYNGADLPMGPTVFNL